MAPILMPLHLFLTLVLRSAMLLARSKLATLLAKHLQAGRLLAHLRAERTNVVVAFYAAAQRLLLAANADRLRGGEESHHVVDLGADVQGSVIGIVDAAKTARAGRRGYCRVGDGRATMSASVARVGVCEGGQRRREVIP